MNTEIEDMWIYSKQHNTQYINIFYDIINIFVKRADRQTKQMR